MILIRLLFSYWNFQWIQAKTKLYMLATAFLALDYHDLGHKMLEASYFLFSFVAGLIFDPIFILFSKKDSSNEFMQSLALIYMKKRLMQSDEFEDWVIAQTK